MAKQQQAPGQAADQLRAEICERLNACRQHEAYLTELGVQAGNYHFKSKSDRPDTMFIYEPTETGRKYIHVGKDPEKQEEAIAKIERYRTRDELRSEINRLESLLFSLDRDFRSLVSDAEYLLSRAESTCKTFDIG